MSYHITLSEPKWTEEMENEAEKLIATSRKYNDSPDSSIDRDAYLAVFVLPAALAEIRRLRAALDCRTTDKEPCSRGSRRDWRTRDENSGASSRNKTPW